MRAIVPPGEEDDDDNDFAGDRDGESAGRSAAGLRDDVVLAGGLAGGPAAGPAPLPLPVCARRSGVPARRQSGPVTSRDRYLREDIF
jgi:hypothetical protein